MRKETEFLPPLATPVDAAEFLRVSRTHIYNLMDAGTLTSRRVGQTRRVLWTEVEALAGVTRRELMAAEEVSV
jgi:excisionase family DNA binding protein